MRLEKTIPAALLTFLIPFGPGCGEETRFFIVQNQVPQVGCVIPAGRSMAYTGEGRLDVALVGDDSLFAYFMFPLLQNDLPRSGQAGSPEPNRLSVESFRVELRLESDAPAAAREIFDALAADTTSRRFLSYDVPWSGTLDPGGGVRSASVGVVAGEVARRLRDSGVFDVSPRLVMTAAVRGLGKRQGGDLETPEFRFPIEVCEGCLIAFGGTCPIAARQYAGHACNVAQDTPVDCCLDGGVPRCPAPVRSETDMTPAP